jgi:hypothetical protein
MYLDTDADPQSLGVHSVYSRCSGGVWENVTEGRRVGIWGRGMQAEEACGLGACLCMLLLYFACCCITWWCSSQLFFKWDVAWVNVAVS